MSRRVKILHSDSLAGLEKIINEFLASKVLNLVDIKFVYEPPYDYVDENDGSFDSHFLAYWLTMIIYEPRED